MAHEVETMFTVATPPWHNLGIVLSDAPQHAKKAIRAAWFGSGAELKQKAFDLALKIA